MRLPGDPQRFQQLIDEMFQILCPGSLSLHLSRFDTKAHHPHHSVYEADRTYFRTTKHRAFIREAHYGEFDYSPSSRITGETYPALQLQSIVLPNEVLRSVWKHIPRLWCLVMDLGEGLSHVATIYRGDALWDVVDREGTDTARFNSSEGLSEALAKIQACEGFDIPAWKRFVQKYWDACVIEASLIESKDAAIN